MCIAEPISKHHFEHSMLSISFTMFYSIENTYTYAFNILFASASEINLAYFSLLNCFRSEFNTFHTYVQPGAKLRGRRGMESVHLISRCRQDKLIYNIINRYLSRWASDVWLGAPLPWCSSAKLSPGPNRNKEEKRKRKKRKRNPILSGLDMCHTKK